MEYKMKTGHFKINSWIGLYFDLYQLLDKTTTQVYFEKAGGSWKKTHCLCVVYSVLLTKSRCREKLLGNHSNLCDNIVRKDLD